MGRRNRHSEGRDLARGNDDFFFSLGWEYKKGRKRVGGGGLRMEVELEAGLDGVIASEVLADGTFIADPGAKAALGPGLARKVSGRAVELSELSEDAEMVRKWCSKALEALDATGYETARVMDLIAALRAAEPVLNLKRCGKVKGRLVYRKEQRRRIS